MEFKKFTKLTNTYCEKTIHRIESLKLNNSKWIVTEKLDGANFSFYYNGTDFMVGSRNQFVTPEFFNSAEVINLYKPKIIDWYNSTFEPGTEIIIVGELIGTNIQNRVSYTYPEGMTRDFYAFCTIIDSVPMGTFWTTENITCVPVVPVLGIMEFQDALEFNETFISTLSPDAIEINPSEGITLEPVEPSYFPNGSRVFLKKKSPEFKEKESKKTKVQKEVQLSDSDNIILSGLLEFVNNSRIKSGISKLGDKANFGEILNEVYDDVISDYSEELDKHLEADNFKEISKVLKREISLEIRKELFN